MINSRLSRAFLQAPSCCCASTSLQRNFTTTAQNRAKLLAHKLDGDNDPMDMANLQDFGYDDIPSAGHLMLEKDRERLHLLRLIAFQLPEIRSMAAAFTRRDIAKRLMPSNRKMPVIRTSFQIPLPPDSNITLFRRSSASSISQSRAPSPDIRPHRY